MTVAMIGLLVLLLLGLNATYVAAEFSLLGVPRSRLEPLVRAGRKGAQQVLGLMGSMRALDRSLTACQIGITIVSLALGMYGEHAAAQVLIPVLHDLGPWSEATAHGIASSVALGGLTFLHIVLGENLPKSIALQYPMRTALRTQAVLRWSMRLAAPFLFLMERLSGAALRLLGVPVEGHGRHHTPEEIEQLIEESGQGGVIGRRQTEILLHLLDFHDLRVRKLMVPRTRVVGMEVGISAAEVMMVIRETEHTRYPVYEGDLDHIVGFLHAKDMLQVAGGEEPFDLRALTRSVPHIPETAMAPRLLQRLREQRVQIAVVLDEHGGTAGIATFEDLIEEIFGEVQDEFDQEEPRIRKLPGGAALVDGDERVDEVNRALELELPEGEFDTVGGLVLQVLGRTARRGDVVTVAGVTLEVEAVRHFAVVRIRLVPGPPGTEE